MMKFQFAKRNDQPLNILCIGAHSDDIEIGCGGTILKILSEKEDVEIHWIVLGSSGKRDNEAVISANKYLKNAKTKNILVSNYEDSFFPYIGSDIKKYFENLKKTVNPDLIFTHYRNDLHQDHRLVSELTWNTFRNHLILEYEIVKYDGDLGVPNLYIHLDKTYCEKKVEYIITSFNSQRNKDWFTPDTFFSLMRIRGVESRAPDKYAEAFYCRKAII